jgi:GT2 family glycosyltransferase
MNPPTISVITVTRNRRELLLRKLKSLSEQTIDPEEFELVVCVNGDEDGTVEAIKQARIPFEVQLITFPENRGVSLGRNACARVAKARLLYFSDDDCLLRKDNLQSHVNAHLASPGIYQGGILWYQEDGRYRDLLSQRLQYWNLHTDFSVLAEQFWEVGGFPEWLSGYGHEDVLLGFRLLQAGYPLVALAGVVTDHIGPDPTASGQANKGSSAGSNAVEIAKRYPEMAFRLGVQPWLLAIKRFLLSPPVGPLLSRLGPGTVEYERAYLRGALAKRKEIHRD